MCPAQLMRELPWRSSPWHDRSVAVADLDVDQVAGFHRLDSPQRHCAEIGSGHLTVLDLDERSSSQLLWGCLANASVEPRTVHLRCSLHAHNLRLSPSVSPLVLSFVDGCAARKQQAGADAEECFGLMRCFEQEVIDTLSMLVTATAVVVHVLLRGGS